jgi:circadian clock protein KaiB
LGWRFTVTETTRYSFRIYVTGQTSRSAQAVASVHRLCEAQVAGRYELEVVDVVDHPDMAEEERILATPTVVRYSPLPRRRVIGDLSDGRLAALALGFDEPATSTAKEVR